MTIRNGKADDVSAVFAILSEVAPEIPVLLDTAERRNAVRRIVECCCEHESCWVSLGEEDEVIGFLLAKTVSSTVPGLEFQGLELAYGGMTSAQRDQGRFVTLIAKAKGLGVPLRAVVKHANKSGMAERLMRQGFARAACLRSDEDNFIWTPSGSAWGAEPREGEAHVRHRD
jgi:hypothetical protein